MERTTPRLHPRRTLVVTVLVLAVSGLLLTGPASVAAENPPNAGTGFFSGEVDYGNSWIPPVNTPCKGTSFSFSATATITLANGDGSFGTWVLESPAGDKLKGSGTSTCENASIAGGTLTIDPITAENPQVHTKLQCGPLSGAFTRLLTDMSAVLGGDCFIDTVDAGRVAIYLRAQFIPSPQTGNGATTPIKKASFAGAFTVVPAGSVG